MNNFYEFINKDIEGKKEQISALPLRTKTNKKKYNETLDTIMKKYNGYKDCVYKYLSVKAKTLIKFSDKEENSELNARIQELKYVQDILNPYNTYVEKFGFDSLLYQLSCFNNLNFKSLNIIINEFLNRFEKAGIVLTVDNFDYTVYVKQYMEAFLEIRKEEQKDYSKISKVFEEIYWSNPELIQHIDLNFRKLLRKYSSQFKLYLNNLVKVEKSKLNFNNYEDCCNKLVSAMIEYNSKNLENIYDIVKLSIDGSIDIEHYNPENKNRIAAFGSLLGDKFDLSNKDKVNRLCGDLNKLKSNLLEYSKYITFKALIDDFKDQFKEFTDSKGNKGKADELRVLESKIIKAEAELDRMNKMIVSGKKSLFTTLNKVDIKNLKIDSVLKANSIYQLYKDYENEYYKSKLKNAIFNNMSAQDVLMLLSSFDYFKKISIQKVYEPESYDELIKICEEFNLFARNPLNSIMEGILIFGDFDIARIISTKYRLSDIKLDEDSLNEDNLKSLINKINIIVRSFIIDDSDISIEKIRFVTKVNKYEKK